MKHKGLYVGALLVAGLAVIAAGGTWLGAQCCGGGKVAPTSSLQAAATSEATAAPAPKCPDCKDGLMCKACVAGTVKANRSKLAARLDGALKGLSAAEVAINAGNRSEALSHLAKVRTTLSGLRDGRKPEPTVGVGKWTEDLDAALKTAARTNRPILVDFQGSDWCGWCIKLHDEVFDTDEFKKYAAENLVLVSIDFPRSKKQSAEIKQRNGKLAARYSVRGFPTVVMLDSAGKEIGRTGYVRGGPKAFIQEVDRIIRK